MTYSLESQLAIKVPHPTALNNRCHRLYSPGIVRTILPINVIRSLGLLRSLKRLLTNSIESSTSVSAPQSDCPWQRGHTWSTAVSANRKCDIAFGVRDGVGFGLHHDQGRAWGLTKGLAHDAREAGIKVNAVMPMAYARMATHIEDDNVQAFLKDNLPTEKLSPLVVALAHRDVALW